MKSFAAVSAACVCSLRSRGLVSEAFASDSLSALERIYLKGEKPITPFFPLEAWADAFLASWAGPGGPAGAVFSGSKVLAAAVDLAAVVDLESLASVLRGGVSAARRRGNAEEEGGLLRILDLIGGYAAAFRLLPLEEDVVFPLASIVGLPLRPALGGFDGRKIAELHSDLAGSLNSASGAAGCTHGEGACSKPEEAGIGEAACASLTAVRVFIDYLSPRLWEGREVPASIWNNLGRNRLPSS